MINRCLIIIRLILIYVYFITILKFPWFFLTCILNIGHVTSKHITYSSHEINKYFFLGFGFKEKRGGVEIIK